MANPARPPKTMVRLSNGEAVELRGFGALKGKLTLRPDIDLTKPIYDQVTRNEAQNKTARTKTVEQKS
jgi:hypothetical protein